MLPILFKIEFTTPVMQVIGVLLCLALVGYGYWSGWRGAESKETAVWRGIPFAVFAGLVGLVGAIYMGPLFSESSAGIIKALVWITSAALVVTSVIYAGKVKESPAYFGGIATVAGFLAIKYGLYDGAIGRGLGAPLHTYGLMIATAFVVAVYLGAREAPRAYPEMIKVGGKMEPAGPYMRERFLDLGFWILVSAIAGSRVLFVITKLDDYKRDWTQIFSISGGLVFYGGFIGATAAAYWYCKRNKLEFLRIADLAIPSVAIGHAIGRLGCLAAGCCWGGIAKAGSAIAIRFPSAAHLPFGGFGTDALAYNDQAKDHRWFDALGHLYDHSIAGAHQVSEVARATGYSVPVYPTQLMESTGELMLFLALLVVRRHKSFNGQVLSVWLMCYAVLRFTTELFRGDDIRNFLFKYPDPIHPAILSTSQTISLGIFITGVAIWALYGRKNRAAAPAAPAATAG
ncbi:MAG TPA: prolipoprotein diacylglyceryl transferase [Myxococcales bacterium]|jgi:phosphatidylglycerol:prolipoprotein diacylglycerol transferase